MIKEILYSFNKRDYFTYFFIFIALFIFINKTNIINKDNILHIVVTIIIIYFLINQKVRNDYSQMEIQNNKLKFINIDKYKYIKEDVYIIDCIVQLKELSNINRVKFNDFMEYMNKFFKYYFTSETKQLKPHEIYKSAKDYSIKALNTLQSFNLELKAYNYLEDNRKIGNTLTTFNINKYIEILKERFNMYLTRIEKNINEKWLEGDINNFSSPIYSDDIENIESDILFSNKIDIY